MPSARPSSRLAAAVKSCRSSAFSIFLASLADERGQLAPGPRSAHWRRSPAAARGRCRLGCSASQSADVVEEIGPPGRGSRTPASGPRAACAGPAARGWSGRCRAPQGELDLAAGDRRPRWSPATASSVWASSKITTSYLGRMLTPSAPQGQVGEEQGVVDDQDLGVAASAAGPGSRSSRVRRALAAHAVAVVAGHFVPDGRQGRKSRSASEPSAVSLRPGVDLPELVELLFVAEQARRPGPGRSPAAAG